MEGTGGTTQAAADWAVSVLAQRLTVVRYIAEWRSQFLLMPDGVPLWRGDVVAIHPYGRYRIQSLSREFGNESPNGNLFRDFVYCGEFIGPV